MATFEIENVFVTAPTRWQARAEFEKILDRKVFLSEIVRDDMEVQHFKTWEDMQLNIPCTYF